MSRKEMPPAIVNNSLANSPIVKLMSQNFKIRVTAATLENTCIFSTASLAFIIFEANKLHSSGQGNVALVDSQIVTLIDRFSKQLKNAYMIILTGNQLKQTEMQAINQLQHRFLTSEMKMMLLQYDLDCVRNMNYMVQNTINRTLTENCIIQSLNRSEDMETVYQILSSVGLNDYDILIYLCDVFDFNLMHYSLIYYLQSHQVLIHYGTIASVALANTQQLMDCNLSFETASKVISFFSD
ncbi:hypothetical protein TrispH2_006270 [Trichoplax sp. H2]|nr:hypothetical protein TrispH2_006270 [Trichoplax sp. H2]|eukprot:RDD40757.1 hypothetical protein TrispH2_006270 [Trichoplax sp. H2]